MSYARVALVIAVITLFSLAAHAQANPYKVAEGWPQLPAGTTWGGVISVDADPNGNIYGAEVSTMTLKKYAKK